MKYVIFLADDELNPGKKAYYPVFFPPHVTHADIQMYSTDRWRRIRGEMVSAGFFFTSVDPKNRIVIKVDQKNKSESTGLGPGPYDERILQAAFNNEWRGKFLQETIEQNSTQNNERI